MPDYPISPEALEAAVGQHNQQGVLLMLNRRTEEEAVQEILNAFLAAEEFEVEDGIGSGYDGKERLVGPWRPSEEKAGRQSLDDPQVTG